MGLTPFFLAFLHDSLSFFFFWFIRSQHAFVCSAFPLRHSVTTPPISPTLHAGQVLHRWLLCGPDLSHIETIKNNPDKAKKDPKIALESLSGAPLSRHLELLRSLLDGCGEFDREATLQAVFRGADRQDNRYCSPHPHRTVAHC